MASARPFELAARAPLRGAAPTRRLAARPARRSAAAAPLRLDAAAQRVHQVDHVRGLRLRRWRRLLAGLLGLDQLLERGLVTILELRRIELGLLGFQDVLGELEH